MLVPLCDLFENLTRTADAAHPLLPHHRSDLFLHHGTPRDISADVLVPKPSITADGVCWPFVFATDRIDIAAAYALRRRSGDFVRALPCHPQTVMLVLQESGTGTSARTPHDGFIHPVPRTSFQFSPAQTDNEFPEWISHDPVPLPHLSILYVDTHMAMDLGVQIFRVPEIHFPEIRAELWRETPARFPESRLVHHVLTGKVLWENLHTGQAPQSIVSLFKSQEREKAPSLRLHPRHPSFQ